jgi:outer membrane protein insertion porin family
LIHEMKITHRSLILLVWIYLTVPFFPQNVMEKIEVKGNQRVPKETILYHFSLFPGQTYNQKDLEKGIKNLWSTGFFSDIKIAVTARNEGNVIILSVEEYPVIKEILFDTEGNLKTREIIEFLKNRNIDLPKYFVYEPERILNIKTTVLDMMRYQGFNQGTIKSEIKSIGKFEANVIFRIREGFRSRIDEIVFEGETKFSKNFLLDAFEFNHEHDLFSWIMGKDFFKEARLDDDLDNLRKLYRNYGYAEIQIGEPLIEEYIERVFFGDSEQMKRIIIPVIPGEIFHVGEVNIINNGPIPISRIHHHILFESDAIFDGGIIDQTVKEIETLYRNQGYLYVRVLALEIVDPGKKKVNITLDIQAGEKVYMRRLYIKGNTLTDNRIIRKVIMPPEQSEFQMELFLESLEKLNRLGIANIKDQPNIESYPKQPEQIDIYLNVEEIYKNEWQLSGGYSRYEGIYLSGFISVVDFFRKSEKIDFIISHGDRYKNYSIGLFKPYLFNQFISLGFNVFDRNIVYPDLFVRRGKGIDIRVDKQIRDYWWGAVNYKSESVSAELNKSDGEDQDERDLGSLKLSLYRNTVDDIFFPARGMRCLFSFVYAGSTIGSDISAIKPEIEGAVFLPLVKDHSIGIHMAYRMIRPFEDSDIPSWERFYLGGERTIRGYEIYTIGPKDKTGKNIGGERSLVLNAEYIIPLFRSTAAVLFFDTGDAWGRGEKISLDDLYWSSGMELRMRLLNFPVPLRLILAYKNRLIETDDSHFSLHFALGVSF